MYFVPFVSAVASFSSCSCFCFCPAREKQERQAEAVLKQKHASYPTQVTPEAPIERPSHILFLALSRF